MSKIEKDRFINYGMFSPKIENTRHLKLNKNRKNFGNYSTYSKYTKSVLGSPINLYSHPKNYSKNNNLFNPGYSNAPRALSPINRNNNYLRKNFTQININERPLSSTSRNFPSVNSYNHNYIKSPMNKRNINKKAIYTNLNSNFKKKQNFYNLETEKLYQETRQIKKIVKILANQLSALKEENMEKDKEISLKEKQINDIILNNNISTFENAKNNSNINTNELNNSIISEQNINHNGLNNDNSSLLNDSIYANALSSNRNSSTSNLFFKIKKEIRQTNNEIKLENDKYEKLKRSVFVTKVNELEIESKLLEEQIKKINSLMANALSVKEENEKKTEELENLKGQIDNQEKIFENLISITNNLQMEENELKRKLATNKNKFKIQMKKLNKNNFKLIKLKKQNDNLKNEKIIQKIELTTKINGNPINISSLYINKVNSLNKSINFYKRQIKFSDLEINKLKEKRKKLIEAEKLKSNQIDPLMDKNRTNLSINKNINAFQNENSPEPKKFKNLNEEKIISNLKKRLKESKESEKNLEEKINIYHNKLKEIDSNHEEEKDNENESQIEFGIDNENPFYIEDENNIPEKTSKFTSSQFNQFTYILFKNFESKGIVLEESKNKIINPFIEFSIKNNITKVKYPSTNFELIIEEFSNIILNVLNCDNTHNHILVKIFISALFYNSECDINKFIEYLNILFSYTKNYSIEEEKYINKLRNKYKEQTSNLIRCISNYMNNELNHSEYFHLLKMKELLDKNELNLKDKYIEFLFYYMKKFDEPKAKLEELKFSLLKNIIGLEESQNLKKSKTKIEDEKDENYEKENSNKNENEIKQENKEQNKNNRSKKIEPNIFDEFDKLSNGKYSKGMKGIKNPTNENYSNRGKIKNHTDKNEKDNSDDYEGDEDEDSMTEITNEEYVKQLTEAINLMQKGLKEANTNFSDLMANVVQKRKITGIFYECITIEDFNDQLKSINVVLSDLKLSCLCSKYSIPNELRLIDKNKIEKDIADQLKGTLKFEEEEDDN